MSLKNKKVLITAGPTWVAIDDVRVISNIATGATGIALAEKLSRRGAKVTLFLGPVAACCISKKVRVVFFRFFDELRRGLAAELRAGKYDIIIHSAAVSDFKPDPPFRGKIDSSLRHTLRLSPLPKIIRDIRRLDPGAKLVMFKLEPGTKDPELIRAAAIACKNAGADLVVANRIKPYSAFIIDRQGKRIAAKSKDSLVNKLLKVLI